jgi:uncharacterized protein (DUF2267 family)
MSQSQHKDKRYNRRRTQSMEEIVKLVSTKAGISEAQAKTAVETVVNFLKQKLPSPIAGQIDAVLAGGKAGDIAKGLGGLLGKK